MNAPYTPQLFELISTSGVALSPWCWHVRMAMAHKGVDAEIVQLPFTGKEPIIELGGKTFPLMKEADGTVFSDSTTITMRLEEMIPEPTLFPGGASALAQYRFLHRYIQVILFPTVVKIILKDIPGLLDGADKEYFVTSREARFGKTLDEVCAGRDAALETLATQFDPFRKALEVGGFISGNTPGMADYLLFGVMQWARVSSTTALAPEGDAMLGWMERMLDLHDGLGRTAPARAS